MEEGFVFYKSFIECIRMYPEAEQLNLLNELIDCSLYDAEPESPSVFMMMQNVKAARNRYEKSIEDGKKGGRPSKYIAPEEWQAFYETHTRKETAEHFGISEDTLKTWITKTRYKKGEKGENLTDTYTYTDTVTETVTDTVSDIYINKGSSGRASEAPALPKLPRGVEAVSEPRTYLGKFGIFGRDQSGKVEFYTNDT